MFLLLNRIDIQKQPALKLPWFALNVNSACERPHSLRVNKGYTAPSDGLVPHHGAERGDLSVVNLTSATAAVPPTK